jgi:hypothetical protein
MQSLWSTEAVGEDWTLGARDLAWLSGLADAGKLGLAVQFMYWRRNGRFPDDEADLAPAVVRHLAAQIGVGVEVLEDYEWTGRTGRRHRRLVLDRLAVASFDELAEARLRVWLSDELLPREPTPPALESEVNAWFAHERVGRPGGYRLDRILRSARAAHDDAALQRVADRLDAGMRERLDALLADVDEGTGFARLATDPGRVSLESMLRRWAGRRHGRTRLRPSCLHKNRREAHLGRVVALTPGRAPAHVTTPAEQLLRRQPMPPRDSRHFVPALVTLGENPRFLFGRPRPPSARSGEDLKPTKRLPLRFVQKLSVRHVSNSLSTQRRQTIDPAPHRGRCGLTTAYG